jgi:hypothetical protein
LSKDHSARLTHTENGSTDLSLASTAHRAHALIAAAEETNGPDIPADAIWEKIMASTAPAEDLRRATAAKARLVSNGAAPSVRTASREEPQPRIVPAWLSGSHWAVSATMLAAVVIGIVALYNILNGDDANGPIVDHGPVPTSSGLAFSTPGSPESASSEAIDQWLVDPYTIDCNRDRDDSGTPPSRDTNRPKPVDNYLPFGNAVPAEQQAVASRWLMLAGDCAPTSTDPLISDDFGWMPGINGGAVPTDDQIAIAQEIAAALPDQDYRDYYIVRETPAEATPTASTTPTDRAVLLPEDIVQLADGRIGGPLRILIESDDPENAITDLTGGMDVAMPAFVIFEQVDDQWLYDEFFLICFGDCDSARPLLTGEATPSVETADLQPISPEECTIAPRPDDEIAAIFQDPGPAPAREYLPVSTPDPANAQAVSSANRVWQACYASVSVAERRAMESPRFIDEITRNNVVDPQNFGTAEEWIATNEDLRAAFLPLGPDSYAMESDALPPFDPDAPNDGANDLIGQVIQPEHLVQLPDGRIGGPMTYLYQPGHLDHLAEARQSDYGYVMIHLFAQDASQDGRWVLDETFPLCVRGCDAYYETVATSWALHGGTPAATPAAATPSTDAAHLQPIAPEECSVEPRTLDEVAALMQDPGETIPRQYGPVQPVSDDQALDISQANRQFQACRLTGNSGDWRAMVSPRLIYEGQGSPYTNWFAGVTYEEYVAQNRELSEALLPDDATYLVISDAMPPISMEPSDLDEEAARLSPWVVVPDHVVQLADGRLGGPVTALLPPDYGEFIALDGEERYQLVRYDIYAQDPTQGGRWVLDESRTLCTGECDAYYAELEQYYDEWSAFEPGLATPETTEEDAGWLVPLTAVDCTVQPLSLEQVRAIRNGSPAAFNPTYVPASTVDSETAQQVADAGRTWLACQSFGPDRTREVLETDRFVVATQYGFAWLSDPAGYIENLPEIREISTQVIDQDREAYWVEALSTDHWAGDPTPDFSETILPSDIVLLADGRVGVPVLYLGPPQGTQEFNVDPSMMDPYLEYMRPFELVRFVIFAESPDQPGTWLVDETLPLCVGNCDELWNDPLTTLQAYGYVPQELKLTATPAATPSASLVDPVEGAASYLDPFTATECDLDGEPEPAMSELGNDVTQSTVEVLPADQSGLPPRHYSPDGEPGDDDAITVADANRIWQACTFFGIPSQVQDMQSSRFQAYPVDILYGTELETLRQALVSGNPGQYIVRAGERGTSIDQAFDISTMGAGYALPNHMIVLSDGRIAAPVTRVVPPAGDTGNSTAVEVRIFVQDPSRENRWVLDEIVRLSPDAPSETAPAIVLPAATPSSGNGDLQPIVAEECDVAPLADEDMTTQPEVAADDTERSYDPDGTVEPALADDVARADRAWQSCNVYGSQEQRSTLQTARFSQEGPGPADPLMVQTREDVQVALDQIEETRDLANAIFSGDWTDYQIESDHFIDSATGLAITAPNFIATVPIPEQAVLLADGRIAVPIARLFPPGGWVGSLAGAENTPYWLVSVHILALDESQDGRWVMDEQLTLCMGDCDQYVTDFFDALEAQGFDFNLQESTPAATPSSATDPNAHWLRDPKLAQCQKNTIDPFEAAIARDLAWEPGTYLPFTDPPANMDLQIASHYLLLNENCVPPGPDGQLVSDTFTIMPGLDDRQITQTQLDIMMDLSAALPRQDPLSLVIEGDPLPPEASDPPGQMASQRQVMIPDDVVMLADGRLGAPMRAYLQTNHPDGVPGWIADTGGWIETNFLVYTEQDGAWMLDEIVPVCVGNCDAYWASYEIVPEGTPGATPQSTPLAWRPTPNS